MRYLTIEQRDAIRNALTVRASTLRDQIASDLRGSCQSGCSILASRFESDSEREVEELDGLESEIEGCNVEQEVGELRRVYDALARLRSPEYGICEDCEETIPFARLRDDPTAGLCLHCQQRRDLADFMPSELEQLIRGQRPPTSH